MTSHLGFIDVVVLVLYLASAMGRLPAEQRWDVMTALLGHAQDATDNCSDKESALPYSVSENRAGHGSESREHPGGEKHAEGFQGNLPAATA